MSQESIAVIGLAGRFPNAVDIDQFWVNLVDGRDCITEFTGEELLASGELPERLAAKHYVRRRPVIEAADEFDARCFGMTPREADIRDPQQRILLELVHTALEHSGCDPARYDGAIGVFAGTNVNRYRIDYLEQTPDLVKNLGFISVEIGNAPDYVATFISHRLGLRGPAMTLQTACSSSLTAIHTACRSLAAGDCDMAVAGVVSVELPLNVGYMYEPGSILAPDGIPKPFSADANGTNFGSGGGAVVLKPLPAALADGDTIHAVIRATALNNDADRKTGFTAPSAEGQADCIESALVRAGIDPSEIDYVEAHGTGTKLGDPVEIRGLAAAYRRVASAPLAPASIPIGSVKANVGHLGQAAGMPGFIKAVLALEREQIPPSIHCDRVNPLLKLDETPFFVNTALRHWPRDADRPRLAAMSSFGIGGTNAHVILEEAPPVAPAAPTTRTAQLLVWSAEDDAASDALRGSLADHFSTLDSNQFADVAHTLRVGRRERGVRAAAVAATPTDAAARLARAESLIRADGVARDLVLCFPGQGAQHPGMAHPLYRAEPRFRRYCDEAFEELAPLVGQDLRSLWLSATDRAPLDDTAVAQPLLFVLETALARCLLEWGLEPQVLVGHSVGELAAATVAGVFEPGDGLRAVAERARLMQEAPEGAMLAVTAGLDDVEDVLGDDVALAGINSRRQVVLSGQVDAMTELAERLRARQLAVRPLGVTRAFHSPAMDEAAVGFEKVLAGMPLSAPALPMVSCATGIALTSEEATSPSFWARQITAPVRFAPAVTTITEQSSALFLEVGPGAALTGLLKSHPEARASSSLALPTMPSSERSGTDEHALARALGQVWVQGMPVDLRRFDADHDARRVPVPSYPYQRRKHWIDPPGGSRPVTAPVPTPAVEVEAEVIKTPVPETVAAPAPDTWSLGTVEWVRRTADRAPVVDYEADRLPAVLVLPAAERAAGTVRSAFQLAGYHAVSATADADAARHPLDVTSDEQWDALFERAGHAGPPTVVAYAALVDPRPDVTLADVDEQVERCVHGLVAGARAAARAGRRHRAPVELVVLTSGAVDVTGAEAINPVTAMVPALLRTVEEEYPTLRCRVIDVAPGTPEDVLARQLASPNGHAVALRGTAVWTPVLRSLTRTAKPGRPRLRQHGTYLVTGGTGGIGLVVAEALAETGLRPRIALLSRSGNPVDALAELEEQGAGVLVVRGDVTDPDSVRSAVVQVERQFGPVNGIIHSAGVPGGGLLERRTRAEMDRVLAPKVRGTLVLEEVFADRPPLDFLMMFSSQAAIAGMYGSGDYAAANAFLDAHAQRHGSDDRWTASVNWPGWSEVGMLAAAAQPAVVPSAEDEPEPLEYRRVLDGERDWPAAEHRFGGRPVLVGTGSLDLVVTAAKKLGLVPPNAPVELRETVFLVPVLVDEPIEVGVVFTPTAGVHRFRVQSRPVGGGGWVHHVNGILLPSQEEPSEVDLDELRGRFPEQATPEVGPMIQFGPRWRCTKHTWSVDGEGVGELELPEEFHGDLTEHPLHPAMLDKAGAVVAGAGGGEAYLPFLYKRFTFFAPLPSRVVTHARTRETDHGLMTIDFEVYDATGGALLAKAHQYTLRRVEGEEFTARLASARPVPSAPAPVPKRVEHPVVVGESLPLLSPRDGAVAFLEVLNGAYPPVVFVEPPGGPLDLPGLPRVAGTGEQVVMLAPHTPVRAPALVPTAPVPTAPLSGSPEPLPVEQADGQGATEVLTALWREALGIEDIGPDDDFFELGGNSLVAVRVIARIRERFDVELSAGVLFEASTIKLLAAELAAHGAR